MAAKREDSFTKAHRGKRVRKLSDSENDSLRSSFRIETGNSQFYTKVPLTHLEIDNAGTGLTRNKRTQASFRLKKMTGCKVQAKCPPNFKSSRATDPHQFQKKLSHTTQNTVYG
ncbi:uncharacterized protein LOC117111709 isoform X4 [Anneissia japonica]|uniref:uncharacterized protein LOC117111709 isoform X4 n=1 Tax=Anneissia japonica TaxID=1529436 RepID=UPI00142564D2|nr:uncharacterized protein LOC117111709 isoform X4 [Anneissia japonica]